MNQFQDFPAAPLDLAVRIGCKLRYETVRNLDASQRKTTAGL
jgi:hypothetical protein